MQVVVKLYHVLLGAMLHGFLRTWMSAKQSAMKPIQQGAFGSGITKKCTSIIINTIFCSLLSISATILSFIFIGLVMDSATTKILLNQE